MDDGGGGGRRRRRGHGRGHRRDGVGRGRARVTALDGRAPEQGSHGGVAGRACCRCRRPGPGPGPGPGPCPGVQHRLVRHGEEEGVVAKALAVQLAGVLTLVVAVVPVLNEVAHELVVALLGVAQRLLLQKPGHVRVGHLGRVPDAVVAGVRQRQGLGARG